MRRRFPPRPVESVAPDRPVNVDDGAAIREAGVRYGARRAASEALGSVGFLNVLAFRNRSVSGGGPNTPCQCR